LNEVHMLAALKNAFLKGSAFSEMKQKSIELFISFFKLTDGINSHAI